ncbi:MAG: hypothetical protein OWU33_13580 [Firmicutes bacterium]|nr:hypothetical protein [Bacillota bacterium]
MFQELFAVAKQSIPAWARKHKIPPDRAAGEYVRMLAALTDRWMEKDSPSRNDVEKLLKLRHAGRVSGIVAALNLGWTTPLGPVPDNRAVWRWIWDKVAPSAMPASLLLRAYWSQHESIVSLAEQELKQREQQPWVQILYHSPVSLTPDAEDAVQGLEAEMLLRIAGLFDSPHPLTHAIKNPWLQLLFDPPGPRSNAWNRLWIATPDEQRAFFNSAAETTQQCCLQAALTTAKGVKALSNLLAAQVIPPVFHEALLSDAIRALKAHSEWFDWLALPLLQVAPSDYVWPRWFRQRVEWAVAWGGPKSELLPYLTSWAELPLGAFPEEVRVRLHQLAAPAAHTQRMYNYRWLQWFREDPEAAKREAQHVFWDYWLEGNDTPSAVEISLASAPADAALLGEALRRDPFDAFKALSDPEQRDLNQLAMIRPPSAIEDAHLRLMEDARATALTLVSLMIRHGFATADDFRLSTLSDTLQFLTERWRNAWQQFSDALIAAIRAVGQASENHPDMAILVREISGLYKAYPPVPAEPELPESDASEKLAASIRNWRLAIEDMPGKQVNILSTIFSPLDKMFDFDLDDFMPAIETALAPLHLRWIEPRRDVVPFDGSRHEAVPPSGAVECLRVRSPGLQRDETIVRKAWGEPIAQVVPHE